jgi:ADP-heptose:LPS heptosyltransferase
MRHQAQDLAGLTNLGEFAAVIAQLDLLVTNDTGASHLAAATQTPSVILFGASRPFEWAPLEGNRHRAIDALALAPDSEPTRALAQLPVAPVFDACTAHFGWSILDFRLRRESWPINPKSKIEGDV